ncbi:MAG: DUF3048 domain-containing protein [Eubacteriales bacterium]|nr:DUF3048 domain-containing protein [Eubacteriales bacterium]
MTIYRRMGKWLTVCMLCVFAAGCSGPAHVPAAAPEQERILQTEAAPETEPVVIEQESGPAPEPDDEVIQQRTESDGMVHSYLTGELVPSAQGNRRPLAVMMSNDKEAQPQYGINRAGVVYEVPVESGMNRFMAVMEDFDGLERIGSVRSCRTYYIYFAREFDAVYAHFGQSTFARPYLKYIDNINGIEGVGGTAFYRSGDRKRPHNAYTSFAGINRAMERLGYTWSYDESYQGHFRFVAPGASVRLNGADAREAWKVTPGYVYNRPWFEYCEDDGLYYRYQYGGPHNGDEGQIAVRNIIIQYCSSGYYATTAYRNLNVHEPSWGYFITGGQAEDITWEKDGELGVTHYYDASGREIVLNPGKTWICVVPVNDMSPAVIEGRPESAQNG